MYAHIHILALAPSIKHTEWVEPNRVLAGEKYLHVLTLFCHCAIRPAPWTIVPCAFDEISMKFHSCSCHCERQQPLLTFSHKNSQSHLNDYNVHSRAVTIIHNFLPS